MRIKAAIWILTLVFLGTGIVSAQVVGKMTLEQGIVKLRRNTIDSIHRQAGKEIEVRNRDEIQTGPNSLATIRLQGKEDEIRLFSNTFFVLSSIEAETSEVAMPIGKSRILIKPRKIVKNEKTRRPFRLRTTNALIGVKGTDFIVGVLAGSTNLLTLQGIVALANINAPDVEIEVKLNQASRIQQDGRPTAPVEVPPQARETIIASDTPASFNTVTFGEEIPAQEGETGAQQDESASESTLEEETTEVPVDELDDIISEVDDIVEEVIEETEAGASEVGVTIEITE